MNTTHRSIAAVAGLLLVLMYFVPMWRITLEAPQYPEGLGLHIWLTDVRGVNEFDLQNINNLNHYIGMKRIEPDAIPELRIMPWAIALIIALALATAATGKRWLLFTWVGVFLALAVAGIVDFWLWEYDYGHNLDLDHAAIKVPGMTYQPPLIGSKQLLNFKAHSWPAAGGWVAFISLFAGLWLAWSNRKSLKSANTPSSNDSSNDSPNAGPKASHNLERMAVAGALFTAVALVSGCNPGPEPFHYGDDLGAHCRMPIVDARFATQIVMKTGKVYKFDSIECLAGYLSMQVADETDVHSVWVSDASNPDHLLDATEAVFVRHPSIRSPMGGGWAAFADRPTAEEAIRVLPATDSAGALITTFMGMRTAASPHHGMANPS